MERTTRGRKRGSSSSPPNTTRVEYVGPLLLLVQYNFKVSFD